MNTRRSSCLLLLAAGLAHAADPDEFFESKVRPVFARNCYACHTEMRADGLLIATDNTDIDTGIEAVLQRIAGEYTLPG